MTHGWTLGYLTSGKAFPYKLYEIANFTTSLSNTKIMAPLNYFFKTLQIHHENM